MLLGWSSYIPNHNPRDIVNNLKLIIDGKEPVAMHPWYRGFQGDIEQTGKDKYKVEGILKMHGVEKPITLDSEYLGSQKDPMGNVRAGFTGTTKVNRKDFGLSWNKTLETGGVMVGDDVTLELNVEAVQAK